MLVEICYNARELGMIDESKIEFSSPACKGYVREVWPSFSRILAKPLFPMVCGNCKWYSVQEEIKEKR